MTQIVTVFSALALGALSFSATPKIVDAGEECPQVCVAQATGNSSGTQPPGVTFLVTVISTKNGMGTTECDYTCELCTAKVNANFDGIGAYCMTYDQGGGWSTPVGLYARTGLLKSRCGDASPASVCFRIGDDCAALPGNYLYEECWLLDCQCIQ